VPNSLIGWRAGRAVPKDHPGAERSGHPRPWEWGNGVRLSATERLLFVLEKSDSSKQGKKTSWSDMITE
jgi:hypothetical protein